MIKERLMIVLGMLINTLIVFVKIFGGIVFSSYTLMVDGYYTLTNMSHEFIAFMPSVIRERRASQKEPFGYGKKESIFHMLFGICVVLISIYILIKAFFLKFLVTDIRIIVIILFVVLFKILLSNYNFSIAKETQSEMLMAVSHHAYYEGVISVFSLIFIILSSIWSFFDFVGTLFLGIIILLKGIKIIIDNILLIHGQNDTSKKIIEQVKKEVEKIDGLTLLNCNLINYNNFYKATLEIIVNEKIVISDLIKYEYIIRKKVKNKKIKMIDFNFYSNN